MSPIRVACIPLIALALVACGDKPETGSASTAPAGDASGADHLLAKVLLQEPPAESMDISTLKSSAQPGQEVVLRGRIGGRAQPFVPGRAAMLVVDDQALQACDANPDDACGTPWDFCCEPQAKIASGLATVQVLGEDGKPVPVDLQGLGGIGPGSKVIISGSVADSSGEGNLIVNATGIYPDGAASPERAGGEDHGHDHGHDHQH